MALSCGGTWDSTIEAVEPGPGIQEVDGATVLTGGELFDQQGSVLRAMSGKIPNMKVDVGPAGRCPAIAFRRSKDIHGANSPLGYLDGVRANDTCILVSLQANDLERVEVYPQGFTTRPGYGTSTHGLILLFSRGHPGGSPSRPENP
jgi:hypothetical protein